MATFLFLAIFAIAVVPSTLAAEPALVVSIEVEGNVRVDRSSIERALSWKVGDLWDDSLVTRNVKALYRLGAFSRAAIQERETPDGVVVMVRVEEYPMVRNIRFRGNKGVSDSDLNKALQMKAFSFYNPADLPADLEAMKDVYRKSGFYDIEITPKTEETETGVRLVYIVEEGGKSLIAEIDILGNRNIDDYTIKKVMMVREKGPMSWISSSGVFLKDQIKDDLIRIRLLYMEHGYLDVVVDEPEVKVHPEGEGLYVAIRVHEGPQYTVGDVRFTGDWDDHALDAQGRMGLTSGVVFVRTLLLNDIRLLEGVYRDIGHARAKVEPRFRKDPEKGLINLEMSLEIGPLVRIRWIKIRGNFKTRDYVIRREMRLMEGGLFSQKKIDDSRQFIKAMGFFEDVAIQVAEVGSDEADLIVKVREGTSGTFMAGFAFSSIDGLVGTLSLSQGNLFGRGQRLNLSTEFGSEKSSYSISFTEPRLFSGDYSLTLDLFDNTREFSNYTLDSEGGGLRVGYRLSDATSISVKYRNAESTVSEIDIDASNLIKEQEGTSTTSSVTLDYKYDTRDFPMDPRTGLVLRSSVEVAGGPMGGTNDFVRTVLEGSYFLPIYGDFVSSVHSEIGLIKAYDGNNVPVTERFFMGGLNTLRGFEYRSVGPLDEDDEPLGGSKSFLINLEIKYPLVRDAKINGVVFLDTGNVWEDNEEISLGDLRKGAGFGFRWSSPLGLLRLEWGFNLDPKPGEENPGWEFSIGTLF
ncbi:MAG: outer membrane protein assembly factor BamA [bacterium]